MAQKLGQQRRADILISALARGESQTTAAKSAGFSLRTVQRRLDDPQFRQAVQQARHALVADAAGRVAGLLETASDALRDLLVSEDEGVRLAAAKAIFDVSLKLRTAADFEVRLQNMEERINGQLGKPAHAA